MLSNSSRLHYQADEITPLRAGEIILRFSRRLQAKIRANAKALVARMSYQGATHAGIRSRADTRNRNPSSPELIVTWDGKTVGHFKFRDNKVTIGRSSLADIVIHNEYASRFHALMILYSDGLALVDLHSANGTFVNSARIATTVLRSDDIISIARHRIKVVNAPGEGGNQLPAIARRIPRM